MRGPRRDGRSAGRRWLLRDSEDFARLALSAVGGVGVWTYDVASDRFTCDAAISELYGIDPVRGAAGVTREEFLRNLHPADAAPLRATMAGGLDRSGDLELEYRIRHPDGSTRWLLSRGNTAFDEAGRPVRRTGIGVETTRLRQLEEELRQSQKMEAVGQLTGGVAHDFNNLLTVIKSSTDLLKRPNLSEERRTRYIAAISETVDRAARLTGQLLAFARRQALQPKVFDAGQSVKTLSDMIGTLMGGRVALVVEVADEPCPVEADPGQFDTALINMAVNARDAMAGVGQLVVAVRPVARVPAVRSHRAVDVPSVAVSIADTGAGIPPHRIDRIFEPFFTTKEVGQGTGLGLSQVFGFAKQSGGEVEVDSVEGEGTTFTLYLPRATSPLAADEPEDLGPTEDGQGISVLVIEDNRDVGTFVTQTLNELGYRTHLVASARAALDDLAAMPGAHEIVFTDVVMPGMNGVELANEIRRLYPDLPVILTSGYSDVLAKDGGHGFALLQKPYSVEALSRASAASGGETPAERAVEHAFVDYARWPPPAEPRAVESLKAGGTPASSLGSLPAGCRLVPERFPHQDQGDRDVADRGLDRLDGLVAASDVEGLATERRHQLGLAETRGGGRLFAGRQDQAPDPLPDEIRMRVHRPDLCRLPGRIEQLGIAQRRAVIAAVESCAFAPATTAYDPAVALDDEVGAILHQLRVQPHEGATCTNLLGRQETRLQSVDGQRDERSERRSVGHGRPPLLEPFRLASGKRRGIGRDRRADEALERALVDGLSFSDIDRAPHVSFEARIEERLRIREGCAAREGELHDLFVGLARADDAVVGPDGDAPPFPLFPDRGVGFVDEPADLREGLAAPVPELPDAPGDVRGGAFVVRLTCRVHGLSLPPPRRPARRRPRLELGGCCPHPPSSRSR